MFPHLPQAFNFIRLFLQPCVNGQTYLTEDIVFSHVSQRVQEARACAAIREAREGNKLLFGNQSAHPTYNTGILGELAVQYVLTMLQQPILQKNRKVPIEDFGACYLDFETSNSVVEVKTHSWTTSGTAHKIAQAVPLYYRDIPLLCRKPLHIILVGYNEFVCTYGYTSILQPRRHDERLQEYVKHWESHNIHYIGFSTLVQEALDALVST